MEATGGDSTQAGPCPGGGNSQGYLKMGKLPGLLCPAVKVGVASPFLLNDVYLSFLGLPLTLLVVQERNSQGKNLPP